MRISNIDYMNIEYRSMESLRSVFIKLPEYIPSKFCGSLFCGSAVLNNSLTGTKNVKKLSARSDRRNALIRMPLQRSQNIFASKNTKFTTKRLLIFPMR
jgi:hypothetical protein